MIYINEQDLLKIGSDWKEAISVIKQSVTCIDCNDYAQPIKPYLRYRDMKNRIIAMPGFVGGDIDACGIKWIASFPDNIYNNIPRAHSVLILNNTKTGEPVCIINTPLLSVIRTASVSGLMADYFLKSRNIESFKLGIIGWGPIGQYHFKMFASLFGSKISEIFLFDKRPVIQKETIPEQFRDKVTITDNWEAAYENADVFTTCTVSKEAYIANKPKAGALLLNVSLRDYKPDIYDFVEKSIIVDDWEEVCRENTDIENMYKQKGLKKEDTKSIADIVCRNCMEHYGKDETIMFNPMGMAVFDIAMGNYYMRKASEGCVGLSLT